MDSSGQDKLHQKGGVFSKLLQILREAQRDLFSQSNRIVPDLKLLSGIKDVITAGGQIDDRKYLVEDIIQVAASLPNGSMLRGDLNARFIGTLWRNLQHPPISYLGDEFRYRTADGSNNNITYPKLGAAGSHYARSVAPQHPKPHNLPDPSVIFDSLMARKKPMKEHPTKVSSSLFHFATLIIHDLFHTDERDSTRLKNSSYLDLSPLYGNNEDEQKKIRTFKDGLLKKDTFAESRLLSQPPGVCALVIAFNRFHNYVVQELAIINEQGRFSMPAGITEKDPIYGQAELKRDNDLFQTGRLITCGLYVNVILDDYLRTILNLNRNPGNSDWKLDPREDFGNVFDMEGTPRGIGNQVSVEFNMIYRWHSAISAQDEKWTNELFHKIFGADVSVDDLPLDKFLQGIRTWTKDIPQDPEKWTFGGLERNNNGSFPDDKLVEIIQHATESVAGAFGARNVPAVLKVVEMYGIQQGREWGLASLNELRQFFKLKPYSSFADVTTDPSIAEALEALYGHPDNIELYPGLLAEDAKKPIVPGSGLCLGFTTSFAILSDAVALVRGDRFYSVDYNPWNLTNFGFNEASSNSDVAGGGVMYKLLMRAFPGWYRANSVSALYPFTTPEGNREIFDKLGTSQDLDFNKPMFIGPPKSLTTRLHVIWCLIPSDLQPRKCHVLFHLVHGQCATPTTKRRTVSLIIMELGLEVYRDRFARVETGLSRQVTEGLELIKELLEKLDLTETQLTKTKLDLDSESEARRRLQKEVQENREWKKRQEKRPFMVVLIDADADGYVFRDSYITMGEKGGEEAADALLADLQVYMRELTGVPNNLDIVVRAFANISGLGRTLVRDGRLQDINHLRAFATGFSNRQVFFDFVDVGSGKERADYKIQENIKFFVDSPQCKHLVVACGHDTGYAPFLGQFVGDKQVAERITLLEGTPLPAVIQHLGLKKTRFTSVFNETLRPTDASVAPLNVPAEAMRLWNSLKKRSKNVAGDRTTSSSEQSPTQLKGVPDPAGTLQQVQHNTQMPPRQTTEQRVLLAPAASDSSTTIAQTAQGAIDGQAAGATETDTEAMSADNSLWDRAYDTLRTEKDNPIINYEALIPADPTARRRLLKTVGDLGLKHMEEKNISTTVLGHEIKLQDAVAGVAKAVEWAEDYVKGAVKDLPHASIVMMRYYVTLEDLLLTEHFGAAQKNEFVDQLTGLYKLIIDFQVRSILRFYRSRTKNALRGSIKYDGWDRKVEDIQKADKDFVKKLNTVISGSSLQKLANLVQSTEGSHKYLDNLVNISRNSIHFIEKIDQRMSDAENNACLGGLGVKPRHHKMRIEGEKGGLLRDSYCWILSHDDFQQWRESNQGELLWIKGDPGKGKTMLLCGVIDELIKTTAHTTNISFFFCQADRSEINQATAVLRGLIYMVVKQQPCLISYLRDAWDDGKDVFTNVNAGVVLSEILGKILEDKRLRSTYFIIDALDECTVNLNLLLDLIVEKSSSYPHVKWIVSSRDWPNIREHLDNASQKTNLSLELNKDTISAAVATYIGHKVNQLAVKKRYDAKTQEDIHRYLLSNANDTFLWVALVCEQLNKALARNTLLLLKEFPPDLDILYKRMMDQIGELKEADLCQRILAIVTTVFEPVTLDELAIFVELDDENLAEIVALCGSFLTISNRVVSLVHKSANDFLLKKEQKNIIFPSGIGYTKPSHRIQALWLPQNSKEELRDGSVLDAFLRQKYLYWLEALSLLRSMSNGMISMTKLEALFEGQPSELADIVQDGCRFIQYCRAIVESNPLQIYASALVFSPSQCLTRIRLQREEPEWLITKPIMEENWSACLQTFEGHGHGALSVAWSPNNQQIASTSYDRIIKIWHLATGQCKTIVGHDWVVRSVAWSPDGQQIASASSDKTVKIWNPDTGQCEKTLEGLNLLTSVSWSPNGQQIAAAASSNERHIEIWDLATGQRIKTVRGGESVAWAPDGQRIATSSSRSTVTIWDLATSQCNTLSGHGDNVPSVTWSPNGQRVASASRDKTIKIWDPTIVQCKLPTNHKGYVTSIEWSPNNQQFASSSYDGTIKIWDLTMRQCNALTTHGTTILKIAWSPDGQQTASIGFYDESIKVWDPATGQCKRTFGSSGIRNKSIVWSPNNQKIAAISMFKPMEIWDLVTGQWHKGAVKSIAWSPGGQQIASSSKDGVKVWDAATGQCQATLQITTHSLHFVTSDTFRTDAGVFNLPTVLSINLVSPYSHDVLLSHALGYGFDEAKT
ncbi:hypothetical protein MKX08_007618 [Trichoderma sp. CBMAI-0020]|nr:hypothetical protein MKX08_007618 [Trichoderma sp. CBMAI-0020]